MTIRDATSVRPRLVGTGIVGPRPVGPLPAGRRRARLPFARHAASMLAAATFAACGAPGGAIESAALVSISDAPLPRPTSGVFYEARLYARGPHEPLSFRIVGGALPPGLALEGDTGVVRGWPRTSGRYRATVEARDGDDPALVRDATVAAARRDVAFDVARGPVVVLPIDPPPLGYAQWATHAFAAAGGTPPYAYEVAGGGLPAGVTLGRDGVLGGFPFGLRVDDGAGVFPVTVRAVDALGESAERAFALRVVMPPLVVATYELPPAARGFPYEAFLRAWPLGAGEPVTWRLEAPAAPPPGVALDAERARLAGTPSQAGSYPLRLVAVDVAGQVAKRDVVLVVNPGPALAAVVPDALPRRGGPVALEGSAFQPGMSVAFGEGGTVPAEVLDASHALVVPPADPPRSGLVDVTVRNPDGGTHTRAKAFRYPLAAVSFVRSAVVGTARGSSRGIAAGDLDGDGLSDLVHVGSSGIETVIAKRTPPGSASPLQWTTKTVRSDGSFNDVRLADVDGDGDLDAIASRTTTASPFEAIEVYRNDGAGKFPATASAVSPYTRPPSHHFPFALATGDVDGDGIVDVAQSSGRGNQGVVWLLRGLGDGSFVEIHRALDTVHDEANGLFGAHGVALADFDGDGRDDVALSDAMPAACAPGRSCPVTGSPDPYAGADDLVAWVALAGVGGVPASWRPVRLAPGSPRLDGDDTAIVALDFDGDGRRDLAVLGGFRAGEGCGVAWLQGDGAGTFAPRLVAATGYPRRFGVRLDANLDGLDDLVAVGGDVGAGGGAGLGQSVAECWIGGFPGSPILAWSSGAPDQPGGSIPGANPGRVVAADFDGDGMVDFAVDQSFHAKERFSNGQGDGSTPGVAVYLNRSH